MFASGVPPANHLGAQDREVLTHLTYIHLTYTHLTYTHLTYIHLTYTHLPYIHLTCMHLTYIHLEPITSVLKTERYVYI